MLVKFLPSSYTQDMEDMDNPQDSTRDERLWSWSIGWVMFKENPVFGVGANNYPWTNHLYAKKSPMYTPKRKILGGRAAHSIYFSLMPELGTCGTVVFLLILIEIYKRQRQVRRFCLDHQDESPDITKFELLFKAMTASAVAFLVSGAFISVLYYPPIWHLIALVAATFRIAKRDLFQDVVMSERRVGQVAVTNAGLSA